MQISRFSLEGSSRHIHEKRESSHESLIYRSPTETISASVVRDAADIDRKTATEGHLASRVEALQRQGSAREAMALVEDWIDRDPAEEKLYTRTILPGATGGGLSGSGAPNSALQGAGLSGAGLSGAWPPSSVFPGTRLPSIGLQGAASPGSWPLGFDPASSGPPPAPGSSRPLIHIDDRLNLMLRMIESLSGRRIDLPLSTAAIDAAMEQPQQEANAASAALAQESLTLKQAYDSLARAAPARESAVIDARDFALSYSFSTSFSETERTEFSIAGSVTLDSGQTLQISHRAVFQYHYATTESMTLAAGNLQLIDPLIVNFSGDTLQLTAERHAFDLDQDGHADRIHFATGSTAFVALDRNRDGLINDGGELFGATSGDGFADLAQYDEDGNGFIDQGDTVYSNLLLFGKDAEGRDQIRSLSDSGIAAIALTSTTTPFTLRGADQHVQGVLRGSGLFITEDGKTGNVHQVDLAV